MAMNKESISHKKLISLSVAVIARDEADRIETLLKSLDFVDEVVVVDSGSLDGTVEICKKYGARVIFHNWLGYARQKQFAMEQCSGEWILNLDADESVSPELRSEILLRLSSLDEHVVAFSIPRLSHYLGKWIYHGGWFPDRKVRLVKAGMASWVGDGIHEKLNPDGVQRELQHPIFHFVYRNIFDQVKTINSFSSVAAESHSRAASGYYVFFGVLHAIGKFLECSIWKRGLLDGVPGLIIAMNSSFYVFLKHAKAWENTRKLSS